MEIGFANELHAISAKTTTFAFRRVAIDEDALLLFGWYHGIVVDREDNLVVGGVDVVCDSGVETCLACVFAHVGEHTIDKRLVRLYLLVGDRGIDVDDYAIALFSYWAKAIFDELYDAVCLEVRNVRLKFAVFGIDKVALSCNLA